MLKQAKRTSQVGKSQQPEPLGFFEEIYHVYQRAIREVGGTLDRLYRLHGHLIKLSFAGTALAKITLALSHWEVESDDSPELTICLWDSASTGTRMPPPPWLGQPAPYTRRGEVRGYNTGRLRTAFQLGSDVLNMLDLQQGLAIYWTHDANHLPQWEIGSPLRIILHWWLHQFGLQYVHAGAVGKPEGGVLLAGRGGAGKSTTSLSCLVSDLEYVSDDYCLISTNSGPAAHNLYNTGKVKVSDLHRVPHLLSYVSDIVGLDDKALIFLNNSPFAEKLIPGFPLKALFIPKVTGRLDTLLEPASQADGLKALFPSTMIQLPGAGSASLQTTVQLVEQIPSYYLKLGTDLLQIPKIISDYLTR